MLEGGGGMHERLQGECIGDRVCSVLAVGGEL